jgi:hypothetical protein
LAADNLDMLRIADLPNDLQFHAQVLGHYVGPMTGQGLTSIDFLDMLLQGRFKGISFHGEDPFFRYVQQNISKHKIKQEVLSGVS